MFTWLQRFRPSFVSIVDRNLYEAERSALEHDMAGKHHLALAEMYRTRAVALQKLSVGEVPPKPAAKKTLAAVPKTATQG